MLYPDVYLIHLVQTHFAVMTGLVKHSAFVISEVHRLCVCVFFRTGFQTVILEKNTGLIQKKDNNMIKSSHSVLQINQNNFLRQNDVGAAFLQTVS